MSQPKPKKSYYEKKPKPVDPEEKLRSCLKCGKDFKSAWNGNRMCKVCKASPSVQAPSQDWHRVYGKHGAAL